MDNSKYWVWSYSKFSRFKTCEEYYRLKDIEKTPAPQYSQKNFFQGSVAHQTLDQLFKGGLSQDNFQLDNALDIHKSVFETHSNNFNWSQPEALSEYKTSIQLVTNYFHMLGKIGLFDADEVKCEFRFGDYTNPLYLQNKVGLVGSIDWFLRFGNDIFIYDAKSSQGTGYLDLDQLIFYATATRKLYNVLPKQVNYLMFRMNKVIPHIISNEQCNTLETRLEAVSRQAEQGLYKASPSVKLCGGCPYSRSCKPFQEWRYLYLNDDITL